MKWLDVSEDKAVCSVGGFHPDRQIPPDGGDWIFVFGSNLSGRHGLGAAALAASHYGAAYGQGVGMSGRSYAIPTKGQKLEVLSLDVIANHVDQFLAHARENPQKLFWVTRIGCGLAGYSNAQIAPLFLKAPSNCNFAVDWAKFLLDEWQLPRPKGRSVKLQG